jgi:hypothetical protein
MAKGENAPKQNVTTEIHFFQTALIRERLQCFRCHQLRVVVTRACFFRTATDKPDRHG